MKLKLEVYYNKQSQTIINSLVVYLLLGSVYIKAQNSNISDIDIYGVIDYAIKTKIDKVETIKIITEDPNYKNNERDYNYLDIKILKKFFTKNDVISMKQQYEESENFLLNPKYIINMRIIHKEKLLSYKKNNQSFWTEFNKLHGKVSFMFVSKPLFSINKKRAIVSYGHYCGGLCGGGERVIVKNENGNWKIEEKLSGFIN
ncbi:hypothetical protein [Chryseobacterium sp. ERMR1:04]|uniref:hypothetical protein n=1 Tax=Chryseobacterium sp. ERMR1:04 TaxID=1705393 RepID=UPI0006C8AFCA|nr:hypothetical protein [Chryseobacterium sp. ERMR1:04]KPH14588.1 hypothetical protein AMQ68_03730 [Chryseobacterium sp. ERMR1:04]